MFIDLSVDTRGSSFEHSFSGARTYGCLSYDSDLFNSMICMQRDLTNIYYNLMYLG